ncbi:hypothetical protein PM082_011775 [Marasmius tenuissimus]|nr:hypothetical protein PM082_011775 [Marasmius tenuissimus]
MGVVERVEPTPTPPRIQTTLYALVILFGIAGTAIGILHTTVSHNKARQVVAGTGAGIATISWIWAVVLLTCCRPGPKSVDAKRSRVSWTRLCITAVLAVLEIACGIMILMETLLGGGGDCDIVGVNFCWVPAIDAGIAFTLFALMTASAICIYVQTTREGDRSSRKHVDEVGERDSRKEATYGYRPDVRLSDYGQFWFVGST